MELYIFIALAFLYVITVFMMNYGQLTKFWLSAFLIAFAIMGISLSFLRFCHQDVMMNGEELSWYYILYLFASMMVVLGLINIWMFRHALSHILFGKKHGTDR